VTGKATFEAVVAAHGHTVLRVCRAVVTSADADDAWSETFLSAMRAYPELPADANVEAWLVTIAHRKAIDITRRSARAPVPTARLPHSPHQPDPADDAADDQGLIAALRRLPPKQRLAVAYHHVGGLPHAQVAEIIGGTAIAARRAAADGIATLRRTTERIIR
jgi:RNA polymerase sigma factor (sigma-70 family)